MNKGIIMRAIGGIIAIFLYYFSKSLLNEYYNR